MKPQSHERSGIRENSEFQPNSPTPALNGGQRSDFSRSQLRRFERGGLRDEGGKRVNRVSPRCRRLAALDMSGGNIEVHQQSPAGHHQSADSPPTGYPHATVSGKVFNSTDLGRPSYLNQHSAAADYYYY
jgi:hypothetical protein